MVKIHRKTHTAKSALNDVGTGAVDTEGSNAVTLYVLFGSGTSAGAVQLEGSPDGNFSGTWAAIGTPVAWTAASKVEYRAFGEAHRVVRARISTAVTGGTCDVYITCGGALGGPAGVWI